MPDMPDDIDKLWDFSDPAASEAKFRELGDSALAMTQLARALGLQQKFDEAHQVLDEVERRLPDEPAEVAVRCHLERGRVFNDTQKTDDAKASFHRAHELAAAAGLDFLAVDALHMLAIVYPPAESLPWHQKASELAAASADPKARKWRATLLNNFGWTQFDLGQHEAALATLEEALAVRRENGTPGPIRIARFCVAKVKRVLGRVEEALAEQGALIAEEQGTNDDGTPVWVKTDGYGNEEIGECLLALGKAESATPYFRMAYDVLSKDPWLKAREPQRIARLKELGEVPDVETDVPQPPPVPEPGAAPLEQIVDDVQTREEAQAWVWLQLRHKRTGEDVVADLVEQGWDEEEALIMLEAARRDPGPAEAGAGMSRRYPRRGGIIGAIVNGIVGIATAIMGVKDAADEEERARRAAEGRCESCGCDLKGSTEPCPNCGVKPLGARQGG